MPTVSVLIATFNQARYLKEAINSLIAQTLDPAEFEVIVIDDGSTDETASVLSAYRNVVTAIRKEHGGLVETCNRGIAIAAGTYVVRVDSDDTIEKDLLAVEKEVLDVFPRAVCAYSDRYEWSDEESHIVRVRPGNLYDLIACGVMIRREALKAVGGYRPFFWEEYDLFIRLQRLGEFRHVPKPLYRYRRHDANMTGDADRRLNGWRELMDEWGPDVLRSVGSHQDLDRAVAAMP